MRLSVRRMLALVAVLTVPLAFWGWRLRTGVPFPAGLDVATIAVTVVSAVVIADISIGAFRGRPRLLRPLGWGLLWLDVAVAVWFTSVEWTLIVENCPACGHGADVTESRLFLAIPRRVARKEFPTLIELIATDLGILCPHKQMVGFRKYRLFGGCLWGEYNPGIHRVFDQPWYPPCARDAVRSWAAKDPNFIRNFRERALLEERDHGYMKALIFRMYDACPADLLPAHLFPDYRRGAGPDSPPSDARKQ
jgi:hypothetical protein